MYHKKLLEIALSWLGTPFHYRAALKNVGTDCVGFIVGVVTELGYTIENLPKYSVDPIKTDVLFHMRHYFQEKPLSLVIPGDILLFDYLGNPQHLAFKLSDSKIIHADYKCGVVISRTITDNVLKYGFELNKHGFSSDRAGSGGSSKIISKYDFS